MASELGISATRELRAEHEAILVITGAIARALDEGGRFEDAAFWRQAIAFLRDFVDHVHHAKEESVLFPRLEMRGVPRQGGPIGAMLAEHERGRGLLDAMTRLLPALGEPEGPARLAFTRAAYDYTGLLVQHVAKENAVLFPLAERLLGAEDDALRRGFAAIDEEAGHVLRHAAALGEHLRGAA